MPTRLFLLWRLLNAPQRRLLFYPVPPDLPLAPTCPLPGLWMEQETVALVVRSFLPPPLSTRGEGCSIEPRIAGVRANRLLLVLHVVFWVVFCSFIQSPVLGESVSMCSPSDDNPKFYEDLLVKSHDALLGTLLWQSSVRPSFRPSAVGSSKCSC